MLDTVLELETIKEVFKVVRFTRAQNSIHYIQYPTIA